MTKPAPAMGAYSAQNEFGRLELVCMQWPANETYDPEKSSSEVLKRQKTNYSWEKSAPHRTMTELFELKRVVEERGAQVVIVEEELNLPVQHFPRDLGFVIGQTLFVGNMRSPARVGEKDALLRRLGGIGDVCLVQDGFIEGGDVVLDGEVVFVGLGEETNLKGLNCLVRELRARDIDRKVVPIEFCKAGILHLDTVFSVAAPELALIDRSAFFDHQVKMLEKRYELIPLFPSECRRVAINTLSLDPKTIVVRRCAERLAKELERRGLEVISLDFSEVCKMPGAFRCCTLPLKRRALF